MKTLFLNHLKTSIAIGALIAGTGLAGASAEAAFRYSYIGNDFTIADSPLTTTMHIEGYFDITNALAASFEDFDNPIDVESLPGFAMELKIIDSINNTLIYSINHIQAANIIGNSSNNGVNAFIYKTDATGIPLDWAMNLRDITPVLSTTCSTFSPEAGFSTTDCFIATANFSPDPIIIDETRYVHFLNQVNDSDITHTFRASNQNIAGTWTVHETPSPEVTGLMLGGLGLMGFAALRRK